MFRPKTARENFVQQIFRVVQVHLDFFKDDLPLFLDVLGIKLGPQDQIGNHVKGDWHMLVEHFGVEADLLFGGKSVEHPADRVHLARNRFRGPPLGAFEHHVLHEVRHADRNRAHVRHRLGQHHQAVRQNTFLNVPRFGRHCTIVTQPDGKKKWKQK